MLKNDLVFAGHMMDMARLAVAKIRGNSRRLVNSYLSVHFPWQSIRYWVCFWKVRGRKGRVLYMNYSTGLNSLPKFALKMDISFYILIISTCLFLQGCTLNLWRESLAKDIYFHRIEGVAIVKSDNSDVSKYLIVSYKRGIERVTQKNYYAIQFIDGSIPQLFDYRGLKRRTEEIKADLPKEQLYRIENYKFSEDEYRLGNYLISSKDFIPMKYWEADSNWRKKFSSDVVIESVRGIGYPVESGVVCFPYFLGIDFVIPHHPDVHPFKEPFHSRCKILMLPNKQ